MPFQFIYANPSYLVMVLHLNGGESEKVLMDLRNVYVSFFLSEDITTPPNELARSIPLLELDSKMKDIFSSISMKGDLKLMVYVTKFPKVDQSPVFLVLRQLQAYLKLNNKSENSLSFTTMQNIPVYVYRVKEPSFPSVDQDFFEKIKNALIPVEGRHYKNFVLVASGVAIVKLLWNVFITYLFVRMAGANVESTNGAMLIEIVLSIITNLFYLPNLSSISDAIKKFFYVENDDKFIKFIKTFLNKLLNNSLEESDIATLLQQYDNKRWLIYFKIRSVLEKNIDNYVDLVKKKELSMLFKESFSVKKPIRFFLDILVNLRAFFEKGMLFLSNNSKDIALYFLVVYNYLFSKLYTAYVLNPGSEHFGKIVFDTFLSSFFILLGELQIVKFYSTLAEVGGKIDFSLKKFNFSKSWVITKPWFLILTFIGLDSFTMIKNVAYKYFPQIYEFSIKTLTLTPEYTYNAINVALGIVFAFFSWRVLKKNSFNIIDKNVIDFFSNKGIPDSLKSFFYDNILKGEKRILYSINAMIKHLESMGKNLEKIKNDPLGLEMLKALFAPTQSITYQQFKENFLENLCYQLLFY